MTITVVDHNCRDDTWPVVVLRTLKNHNNIKQNTRRFFETIPPPGADAALIPSASFTNGSLQESSTKIFLLQETSMVAAGVAQNV